MCMFAYTHSLYLIKYHWDPRVELTKKLGWTKPPISLEVEPEAEEKVKLMLVGKILNLTL